MIGVVVPSNRPDRLAAWEAAGRSIGSNSGLSRPSKDWNSSDLPLWGVAVSKTRCWLGLAAMRLTRW